MHLRLQRNMMTKTVATLRWLAGAGLLLCRAVQPTVTRWAVAMHVAAYEQPGHTAADNEGPKQPV